MGRGEGGEEEGEEVDLFRSLSLIVVASAGIVNEICSFKLLSRA